MVVLGGDGIDVLDIGPRQFVEDRLHGTLHRLRTEVLDLWLEDLPVSLRRYLLLSDPFGELIPQLFMLDRLQWT